MTINRPLRVFLCHSSNDKPAVRELYQKLRAEPWIDPWLDEKKLLPGQDWDLSIEKAVEDSHAVLVCVSNDSVTKEGYIQKELRFVLDIALTKPEEEIFVIPLRLENCQPPRRLRAFHYVDYFPQTQQDIAYQFILQSLKRRAESLGIEVVDPEILARQLAEERAFKELQNRVQQEAREKIRQEREERLRTEAEEQARNEFEAQQAMVWNEKEPIVETSRPKSVAVMLDKITLSNGMEFMHVPAGKFLMGSNIGFLRKIFIGNSKEAPQHLVDIPYEYRMARYPVTNEQYNIYAKAKNMNHPVSGWENKKDHPVVSVTWHSAMDYCGWLNNLLRLELPEGMIIRLPTEAEWEKASRGTDGREYPWGNTFDKEKFNSRGDEKNQTTPIGEYSPQGDSPYGCGDMLGNVWEWTISSYKTYPYDIQGEREDEDKNVWRIARGGTYKGDKNIMRCAYRLRYNPYFRHEFVGIRICLAPPLPK